MPKLQSPTLKGHSSAVASSKAASSAFEEQHPQPPACHVGHFTTPLSHTLFYSRKMQPYQTPMDPGMLCQTSH